MILTAPMPFREALESNRVKSILLTSGNAADLQRLEPAIKRRAMMSATVSIAQPLVKIRAGVQQILAGYGDQASVRLGIKQLWSDLGYKPDPELAGGLQDLSSTQRINLQIETNVAVARGAGWHEQGMQADVLDEFPARELFNTSPGGDAKKRRNWAERWAAIGGTFYGERMIALVTDPIWKRLGDPANFPDALGNEFPPFAFNSAWRTRDIDRDEAESLGLLDASTTLTPQPLDLDADLAASPELRESWLREAITDSGVGRFDAAGVLQFSEGDA
jgi:hypothetical protein